MLTVSKINTWLNRIQSLSKTLVKSMWAYPRSISSSDLSWSCIYWSLMRNKIWGHCIYERLMMNKIWEHCVHGRSMTRKILENQNHVHNTQLLKTSTYPSTSHRLKYAYQQVLVIPDHQNYGPDSFIYQNVNQIRFNSW